MINPSLNESDKGRFKWTKERTATLINLYTKNFAIASIAKLFEVSPNAVSSKIKRLKEQGKL